MTRNQSIALQLAVLIIGAGLVLAMLAPADGYMGMRQKIMYVHVPMAIAMAVALAWFTVGSVLYLGLKLPVMDHMNQASAQVALVCSGLVLATGSIWGRTAWGVWWQWDPRLTSTALMFIYLCGAALLRGALDDPTKGRTSTAALGIFALPGYFVIHMSVNWWNSLHQQATILTPSGAKIAGLMKWTLLTNVLGWVLLMMVLLTIKTHATALAETLTERREALEDTP